MSKNDVSGRGGGRKSPPSSKRRAERTLPFMTRKERVARIAHLQLALFDCKRGRWVDLTPTVMERSS
ncbi:hypothetical protein ACQR18_26315 [Bradyrhizobium oligotrophicum]|uniref:hypothetical protein n=1 Tax=Bradyrhizobium oligotrophicum TaxID=44255 RepID=UPI003EBB97B7